MRHVIYSCDLPSLTAEQACNLGGFFNMEHFAHNAVVALVSPDDDGCGGKCLLLSRMQMFYHRLHVSVYIQGSSADII